MSNQVKLLAFGGSLRKDSYNKKLVKVAAKGAGDAGAKVTYVDIADYPMPIFDEDLEKAEGMPEKARALKELMIESDGFLISSPEYNGSISAALKNAIDWASRKEGDEATLAAFKGKTVVLMAASPGGLGGLRGLVHIRAILGGLGMYVLPDQVAVSKAYEAFDEDGNLTDESMQKRILGLGKKVAKFTAKFTE